MNLNFFSNVAVISGSTDEPELKLINYQKLDILDFNEDLGLFDLDKDWETDNKTDVNKSNTYKECEYDIVFCNQVFEHIFLQYRL